MIVNERIVSYIHSLEKSNSVVLNEIEKEAIATYVPIIRKEMESFLRVMLTIKQPKRILELGTAIGYSAILMSEYMPKECVIDTIENYEKRIPIAKANFERAGVSNRINLYEGDAMEIMPTLKHKYDFVFMDAAKAQYIYFLPLLKDLMEDGAILITDNVLQDGDIIESRFGVTRRNRTIHSRMREYMYEIKNSKDFETTIVPIGDGITLSVKKGE
ncbi:MAG: O-methyltransferase [Lachnospiraceae bacterium]|nr:O-methyltransferase [Lachnospiraceae bacterium]